MYRLKFLWFKAFKRALAGVLLIQKLSWLSTKNELVGKIDRDKKRNKRIFDYSTVRCLTLPTDNWHQKWTLFISFLLIWTAVYVPLKVAFMDETPLGWFLVDCAIDVCFLTDLVFNFFLAIERKDGIFEVRKAVIAKEYLKFWFWIDLASSLPF